MELLNKKNRIAFCEKKLIPLIKDIAIRYITEPYVVEKKSQGNFTTTVDKQIEEDLINNLLRLLPTAGFIAEEKGADIQADFNWIIDPIDGTTNFIYGLPYAISVALSYKNQENILLGVVYNPKDDILYYACKDSGSFVIEKGSKKQLSVRSFSHGTGIAIFGVPYNREKTNKILEIAKKIYESSADLKRIGPSSLDICLVAEGKAKVYFELDLNVWDISAALLVLLEAGGNYFKKEDLFVFGGEKHSDFN